MSEINLCENLEVCITNYVHVGSLDAPLAIKRKHLCVSYQHANFFFLKNRLRFVCVKGRVISVWSRARWPAAYAPSIGQI